MGPEVTSQEPVNDQSLDVLWVQAPLLVKLSLYCRHGKKQSLNPCYSPILMVVVVVQFLSCVRLFGPHGLQPARLFCPWDFPGKNTGVGCHFLLQGIVPTQGSSLCLLHWQVDSLPLNHREAHLKNEVKSLSRVQLLATSWAVACQTPPSLGFSRQEYWSRLPFPSSGDLPDPGIKPGFPTLEADALTSEPPGKGSLLSELNSCTMY